MMNFNPQMIMGMLQQMAGNNPVFSNVINMVSKGDTQGVENFARNLCKERGVDPDEMFKKANEQFFNKK